MLESSEDLVPEGDVWAGPDEFASDAGFLGPVCP